MMKVHRICIVSYSPGYGGISSSQYSLLKYWEGKNPVLFIDEMPQYSLKELYNIKLSTIKTLSLPIWSQKNNSINLLGKINNFKPDVIFVTNIALMVFYGNALRKYCKKSNCLLRAILHSGMLNFSLPRFFLEIAEALSLSIVDERIYVSNFTKRRWENRYIWLRLFGKSKVAYNSICPMPQFIHRKKPDIEHIGFVGSIEPVKRPELFCRIANKTRNVWK